jgi:hypothetical protein
MLIVTNKEINNKKESIWYCLYLVLVSSVNLGKCQYEYVMLHVQCNNKFNI